MKRRNLKTSDYKLQKQLAARDSQRDAHKFVYGHKDLILGASMDEIDRAVEKIAAVLTELRIARLDAEIAKRAAVTEFDPRALYGERIVNEIRLAAIGAKD